MSTPADANYAVFEGLTASTLTLTLDAHPLLIEGPASLCGFQIVAGRTAPPARIGIEQADGSVRIDWTGDGVLQQTIDLKQEAAWGGDVPAATSPYTVPAPSSSESFRLRKP